MAVLTGANIHVYVPPNVCVEVVSSVWWQKYTKQVVTAHMHHQQPTETQYFGINIIKWNIYYIQQSTINGEQYTHTGRTTFHTQAEPHFTTWAEQHCTHKPNNIHLLGLTTKLSSFGFGITKRWMYTTKQKNNNITLKIVYWPSSNEKETQQSTTNYNNKHINEIQKYTQQ